MTMEQEIWRRVPFAGYEVSNLGRVRSLNYHRQKGKKKELKPRKNPKGYLQVCLYYCNEKHFLSVHRLVAICFCQKGSIFQVEVNHKDGNKANNTAVNLEWCTAKENTRHAIETGLRHRKRSSTFIT